MTNETRGVEGCHEVKGESEEQGCLQYQKPTFEGYSREILGYVAPYTKVNAEYVATMKVQKWLDEGKTEKQALLYWNAGEGAKKCSRGVNRYNQRFDSCEYVKKGLTLIDRAYAEN